MSCYEDFFSGSILFVTIEPEDALKKEYSSFMQSSIGGENVAAIWETRLIDGRSASGWQRPTKGTDRVLQTIPPSDDQRGGVGLQTKGGRHGTVLKRYFCRAMEDVASQRELVWLSKEFERLPQEWREAIERGEEPLRPEIQG
jgi:hypothetical protein